VPGLELDARGQVRLVAQELRVVEEPPVGDHPFVQAISAGVMTVLDACSMLARSATLDE
jgi:hypothetical protein